MRAHDGAVEQYQDPEKRRGGKKHSSEVVVHKTAWAAVKKKYKKQGDKWLRKQAKYDVLLNIVSDECRALSVVAGG